MEDGRELAVVLGQAQDVDAIGFRYFRVGIGKDVEFAAACLDFLEIRFELVEQLVVRRDGNDRHVRINKGQRAVLEFTGRVGFGVDVGNFLEL